MSYELLHFDTHFGLALQTGEETGDLLRGDIVFSYELDNFNAMERMKNLYHDEEEWFPDAGISIPTLDGLS